MMKVLTDPKSKPVAALEAARNLATLGDKRRIGTMVWTGSVERIRAGPNPAIAAFRNPTVAEAILVARDRHLKTFNGANDGGYQRRRTEDEYAGALIELGDPAITPELKRRFDLETNLEPRRRWATICLQLRDDGPMRVLAAGFKAGTIPLPPNDRDTEYANEQPGNRELTGFIDDLSGAELPFCDEALEAIIYPEHPYHALAASYLEQVLNGYDHDAQRIWFRHPFVVKLLRGMMDHDAPSGDYEIAHDRLSSRGTGSRINNPIPEVLADPANRLDSVTGHQYDPAAIFLSSHVLGAPAYHPLLKNADQQLKALKAYLDRFASNFRRIRGPEYRTLRLWEFDSPRFIAPIDLHGATATAADVAAGRAIFHLAGHGKAADLKLPATASLKKDADQKYPPRLLIVQAERDGDGKLHYGIIARHEMREALEDELVEVQSVEDQKDEP